MSRFSRRTDLPALGLAMLAILLALPVLAYPLGRDQGTYANIAQSIRAGGLPYLDMWDIKPPAIYYLYAAAFSIFGATPPAVHALDLIFVPLTLIPLYGLTRRLAGIGAARWAMLILPVFYFTETFASISQSDSLVILPMTWAVWAVFRAGDAPRGSRSAMLWALVAGGLCATVLWFKHYYVAFALMLALEHVLHRRTPHTTDEDATPLHAWTSILPWREGIAFGVGGLLIGLPIFLYFYQTGVWGEMIFVAQGTSGYNAQAFSSVQALVEQFSHYLAFRWSHWGMLLVCVGLSAFARFTPNGRLRWVILWLVAGLAFVFVQGKGFDTHWLPLLPPLTMLAAAGVNSVLQHLTRLTPRLGVVGSLLVVGFFGGILAKDTWVRAWPYFTGDIGPRAYARHFQAGDIQASESLRMAQWLQERYPAGETIFIWGFRPEIAFMAGLTPATRFQNHFPLVGNRYPDGWKQENVDTLWQVLPPVVIVIRADYMSWVTGVEDDSNTILANDYPALRDWLIYNYDRGEELGNFLIWTRKEG